MIRPSPQEQSPVDCRACRHCFDVRAGRAFRCGRVDGSTWIPWHLVASDPCDDFDPKPATASHPVSTDLEGTDLLKALSPLLSQLPSLRLMELVEKDGGTDRTAGACLTFDEVRALRRAISSEEARRARPDPKDAAILAMANALILVRGTLNMFEHGRPLVTSAIASLNEAVRLPVVDKCLGDADLKETRPAVEDPTGAEIAKLRAALARLAEWPDSTPEQPSITRQDESMRAFARAAISGPAVEDLRDAAIMKLRALLGRCATALATVAIPALVDAEGTARINECSPILAQDRLAARLARALGVMRALADALRAAGGDPTADQKGIVKDDLGPEDWGDPREEKWPR